MSFEHLGNPGLPLLEEVLERLDVTVGGTRQNEVRRRDAVLGTVVSTPLKASFNAPIRGIEPAGTISPNPKVKYTTPE